MAAIISSALTRTAAQKASWSVPSRVYNGVVLIALGALGVYAINYKQKENAITYLPPINLCTARRAYDNPALSREDLQSLTHRELSKLERVSEVAGLTCGSLCTLFLGGLDYAVRRKIFHKAPSLPYTAFLILGVILSYKIQALWSSFLGPRIAQEMILHQVYSKMREKMNERLSKQLQTEKEKIPIFEISILDKLVNTKCLKSIKMKTWFEPNSLSIPANIWKKEASDVQSFILNCAGCSVLVFGIPLVPVDTFPYYLPYPRSYIFSEMCNRDRQYREERCKGSCFGSTLLWLKQFQRQNNFESALYYCTTPKGKEEAYKLSHYQYYVNDEKRAAFLSIVLQLPSSHVKSLPVDGINYSPHMTSENLFALLDTHKGKSLFLFIERSDGSRHSVLLHSSENQHFIYESLKGVFSFSGRESLALKTSALYFDWHLTHVYAIEAPSPKEKG